MAEQDSMLRREELAEELDVGIRTLVRWASQGHGPKPIKIGPRAVRYSRRDVDEFLATRVAS